MHTSSHSSLYGIERDWEFWKWLTHSSWLDCDLRLLGLDLCVIIVDISFHVSSLKWVVYVKDSGTRKFRADPRHRFKLGRSATLLSTRGFCTHLCFLSTIVWRFKAEFQWSVIGSRLSFHSGLGGSCLTDLQLLDLLYPSFLLCRFYFRYCLDQDCTSWFIEACTSDIRFWGVHIYFHIFLWILYYGRIMYYFRFI